VVTFQVLVGDVELGRPPQLRHHLDAGKLSGVCRCVERVEIRTSRFGCLIRCADSRRHSGHRSRSAALMAGLFPSESFIHETPSCRGLRPSGRTCAFSTTPQSWRSVRQAPALDRNHSTFLVVDAGEARSSSQRSSFGLEGLAGRHWASASSSSWVRGRRAPQGVARPSFHQTFRTCFRLLQAAFTSHFEAGAFCFWACCWSSQSQGWEAKAVQVLLGAFKCRATSKDSSGRWPGGQ